ncbi:hypothetical protein [Brevundimonas sp.]|jgi:hypothetical protein|uniref:hypothetical protein n=1 Tax=Brevundimonas sp. TaxID=1871086 RepID=UPI002E13F022|nr:hypothetical protein [Brevundimonas sp.]
MFAALAAAVSLSGLVAQDPPPAPEPVPAYAPPPVRPFEPPSDFGRETAQGDAAARPSRAPIAAPVTVDAYGGQYEAEPATAETAYAQGVASAELSMDALAGPMDGRWSVVDERGRPLMRLVLSDPGVGLPVEGAWREAEGADRGGVSTLGRDPDRLALALEGGGRLELAWSEEGWSGAFVGADDRRRAVRLAR